MFVVVSGWVVHSVAWVFSVLLLCGLRLVVSVYLLIVLVICFFMLYWLLLVAGLFAALCWVLWVLGWC